MALNDIEFMFDVMSGSGKDYEGNPIDIEWTYVSNLPDADVMMEPAYQWQVADGQDAFTGAELACVWADGDGLYVIAGNIIIDNPGHEMERRYRLTAGGKVEEVDNG